MRYAIVLFALLAASCVSERHTVQDLLTPDQFHVYFTDGSGDSTGSLGGTADPWRFVSSGDTDYSAWTFGLSWDLTGPPRNPDLERAARDLAIAARLMAGTAPPPEPEPEPEPEHVVSPPEPEPDTRIAVELRLPDELIEALGSAGASTPTEPSETSETRASDTEPPDGGNTIQGVQVLGVSGEVWTQLIVALAGLLTALGAYLGRNKIPVVRNYTKEGKERRAKEESGQREMFP